MADADAQKSRRAAQRANAKRLASGGPSPIAGIAQAAKNTAKARPVTKEFVSRATGTEHLQPDQFPGQAAYRKNVNASNRVTPEQMINRSPAFSQSQALFAGLAANSNTMWDFGSHASAPSSPAAPAAPATETPTRPMNLGNGPGKAGSPYSLGPIPATEGAQHLGPVPTMHAYGTNPAPPKVNNRYYSLNPPSKPGRREIRVSMGRVGGGRQPSTASLDDLMSSGGGKKKSRRKSGRIGGPSRFAGSNARNLSTATGG